MKYFKKYLLGLAFVLFTWVQSYSQDVLTLRNGEKIDCIVIEVFEDRITYLEANDTNEILYTISRAKLESIRLSNGKLIQGVQPQLDDNLYYEDRKRNLKFNFFSPLNNVIIFTYEHALSPTTSFELTPKVFGFGISDREIVGLGLDAAYKMKVNTIVNKNEYLPNHLLHGSYGRLAGGLAQTDTKSKSNSPSSYIDEQTIFHMGLDFGKQWILKNTVSLDVYFGFHYYFEVFDTTQANPIFIDQSINHGDLIGSDNFIGAYGFRIGFVFDQNK